jgi:predicted nucleotidyltransferase component of viral defense system
MIPANDIIEWSEFAPWYSTEQVEQDLVISRSLVELFSDEIIRGNLAFRGGTAIHKLFLHPQPRYSEDIDLVQIEPRPFGPLIDRIRDALSFLGEPKRIRKKQSNTLIFKFDSEIQPVQPLRLKVETNCREHNSVVDVELKNYEVKSSWFQGSCEIKTFQVEELLATKLRALYQRKKGRDLYDLYKAISLNSPDSQKVLKNYDAYMRASTAKAPTRNQFLNNLDEKIKDDLFLRDTDSLLRPEEKYDPDGAYNLIRKELIDKL